MDLRTKDASHEEMSNINFLLDLLWPPLELWSKTEEGIPAIRTGRNIHYKVKVSVPICNGLVLV